MSYECVLASEFCTRCGRRMVATRERGRFDADTGERRVDVWHSCPRYFGRPLLRLLTLGAAGDGGGHDSHSQHDPLVARCWQ